MKSRSRILCILIIAILGLFFFIHFVSWSLSEHKEELCRDNLRNIRELFGLYINEHNGNWPDDIAMAAEDSYEENIITSCPGVTKAGQDGYIYLNWHKQKGGPSWGHEKYPVVYDSHLSNHGGRGINILMTDGEVVWDPDAEWLKQFALRHPALKIPIPP